ncbi:MAG TPA: carbohydrate kinase [Polyangiaceae bacterium]|jgi:fructokinase
MNDVVAFGELLWDVYEIAPDTYKRMPGGAPANLAYALARLGARASIVGAVSRDAFGDALVARMRAAGVDVASVVRLPNRTGLAFVRRDRRGEPSFLFYRHETADMVLAAAHLRPRMLRAKFAALGTSTLLREPLVSATWKFVELAERAGAALAVDLNVRAHLWSRPREMREAVAKLASRAALVKASSADLEALGGERFLRRHAREATWILTAGPNAARAVGVHGAVEIAAERARCVDATGAGDAFFAGVLAVLSARGARPGSTAWRDPAVFSDALRVGHMLGRRVVSKVGAVAGLSGLAAERALLRKFSAR